jgi:YfiH family protein
VQDGFECIAADWPAPPGVHAFTTTRRGGVSAGVWAGFNLGQRCGDEPDAVERNRALLQRSLPGRICWVQQAHGVGVQRIDESSRSGVTADAQWTSEPGRVCAVLTADCLPVTFCSHDGEVVGVAHAGWRGLAGGVLEATLAAMPKKAYLAWLGPAIGPDAFEVRDDVVDCFAADRAAGFKPHADRWLMDLYELARVRLQRLGVDSVHGGRHCTHADARRFYSYRRDGETGRMATVIWRDST